MARNISISLALLFVLFAGCSTVSVLPTDEEVDASIATTTWLEHHYGVSNNFEVNKMLARVTKRLGDAVYKAALEEELDREIANQFTKFPWQVFVLNTEEPNAFCAGGGAIFITNGLFRQLSSEAQLAAIIAHEMAHQLLSHPGQAIETTGLSEDKPMLTYSLEQELDADNVSLKILQVAHYDLRHAIIALNVAYRPILGSVTENPQWMVERLANYHRQLNRLTPPSPSTQTSREFNRVIKLL